MKKQEIAMRPSCLLLCALGVFLWAGNVLARSATDTIQAESYSGQSGVTTESCREGGLDVTSIQNGSYIFFNNVDFGASGIQCFEARIASYGPGGFIEVHLDSLAGTMIANCETRPVTGAWQTWVSRTCRLSGVSGVHTIYLKFTGTGTGNLFSLNWFKFHGTPAYTSAGWRVSSKAGKGHWNGSIDLAAASGSANVTVFPDTFYQRVEGHGGAFNDNGWHCIDTINKINPGSGNAVVKALFDPVDGLRLNMGRVPIGMSDFTTTKNYSLDEIPAGTGDTTDYTLKYFTLVHDSAFNMPYCRMAQQYQPNLQIYATPWTPPSWMKLNKNWQGTGTATMDTNSKNMTTYATYFRKMVQGWQNYGIPIFVVCPQNEPTYTTGSHPSCKWPGTGVSLMNFCRDFLWPEFNTNGIATEIWMGTFYENGYATDIGPTLSNALARQRITGCGLQRGGAVQMQQCQDTANKKYNLNWHAVQTENWCQSGLNNWYDAMNTFSALFDFWTHGTNSFNFWNMILDSNYNYVTWMSRAQNAMVIINPKAKPLPTVMYTGEYYTMKHFTYYVAIGATRIKTTTSGSGLTSCAFKNPDGSIVVEIMNTNKTATSATIQMAGQSFTASLPDSSANTFILGGNPDTREWNMGTTAIQYAPSNRSISAKAGTFGVYDIKGRLVKLLGKSKPSALGNIAWDRTDASGRKAAPGMYVIRSLSGKDVRIQKVMVQ